MTTTEMVQGAIIWHDLMTSDSALSRSFYAKLLGWQYAMEHTTDFAWHDGKADYPLILSGKEAQGGIVEGTSHQPSRWRAYVATKDVTVSVAAAMARDGHIQKPPFNVASVGQAAVLEDLAGGIICPLTVRHAYTPPKDTFGPELLFTKNVHKAETFYTDVFHWHQRCPDKTGFYDDAEHLVAQAVLFPKSLKRNLGWCPCITVKDADLVGQRAEQLGGRMVERGLEVRGIGRIVILTDPLGAVFGLQDR